MNDKMTKEEMYDDLLYRIRCLGVSIIILCVFDFIYSRKIESLQDEITSKVSHRHIWKQEAILHHPGVRQHLEEVMKRWHENPQEDLPLPVFQSPYETDW